jgi:hypothetical protein
LHTTVLRKKPVCHGRAIVMAALLFFWGGRLPAATLTLKTNVLGGTPAVLGYNNGHYNTNSNTGDWWRYSGVTGARVFLQPSDIEFGDEVPPWGDGVTSLTAFTNRQAALRADVATNPTDTAYINWPYLATRFQTRRTGDNKWIPDTAFTEWQQMGVGVLVNLTASSTGQNSFTNVPGNIADTWELWHRFYEAAFYMAQHYNIARWQMYNEPNGSTASITNTTDYLNRLYFASDAIQSAIVDVGQIYGRSLSAQIHSPVTAGGPQWSPWGSDVVKNRHKNYLGVTNSSYYLTQVYDYHEYDQTGSQFGSDLAGVRSSIKGAMSGETPYPICLSEFDDYIDANTSSTTTMDSTTSAALLGSIAVNLAANLVDEMYCFKFSQTTNTSTLSVSKNGLHWVDNSTNGSYNVGGITKSGEAWRLFNKAFAPHRTLVSFGTDSTTANLDALASYDPATGNYYLYSANTHSSSYTYTADFSAWNVPANQQVLVEEVGSTCYGAGKYWTNLGGGRTLAVTQSGNTILLFTVPSLAQQPVQTVAASDDATVADGSNAGVNYGSAAALLVKNHSTDASQRNAAFLKFHLAAPLDTARLQLAVLNVTASSINGAATVQAHVYGLTNNGWTQGSIVWSNAPNLAQGVPGGNLILSNYVAGSGDCTRGVATPNSAQLVGQLVAGATAASRTIDVTRFLKSHPGTDFSFLLAREVRYDGDSQDTDGMSVVSTEGNPASGPQLQLVFTVLPAAPRIVGVTRNADQTLTLGFAGTPGQTYQVQAATNLAAGSWLTLQTTNLASTNWVYVETQATNLPARFYRALAP